jgi:succinate-semialdehyde dehydrogenase / glutarate-semialdehyde dehydrogenase
MVASSVSHPSTYNGTGRPAQISSYDPISGQHLGDVPNNSPEAVRAAVMRARAAQPLWQALGVRQRAMMLRVFTDMLWQRMAVVADWIRQETGKNLSGAYLEIANLDALMVYLQGNAEHILATQTRPAMLPLMQTGNLHHEPYGVVGALTPWNYPLFNAFCDILPALVAGNTVVMKPSEFTSLVALKVAEVMYAAGVPRDVFIVMTGDGATGAALVDYVDYVALTGSTTTGRKVALRCAERLIPCCLELGGKDPLIVLEDANIKMAAISTLRGALDNAGQMCISTKRVYVVQAVYQRYIEHLLRFAHQLQIGTAADLDIHMGSLTTERELLRTEAHVADAVARGARLVWGGKRRPDLGPLFYEPAILTEVNHTMQVMNDETFGPVIPIVCVADAAEAIRLANDSEFGLSASIYTGDVARGKQLANQLECGDVNINETQNVAGAHALPWGGRKLSGLGRRGGPEGLLRFVQTKAVLVDQQIAKPYKFVIVDTLLLRAAAVLRVLRHYLPFL